MWCAQRYITKGRCSCLIFYYGSKRNQPRDVMMEAESESYSKAHARTHARNPLHFQKCTCTAAVPSTRERKAASIRSQRLSRSLPQPRPHAELICPTPCSAIFASSQSKKRGEESPGTSRPSVITWMLSWGPWSPWALHTRRKPSRCSRDEWTLPSERMPIACNVLPLAWTAWRKGRIGRLQKKMRRKSRHASPPLPLHIVYCSEAKRPPTLRTP